MKSILTQNQKAIHRLEAQRFVEITQAPAWARKNMIAWISGKMDTAYLRGALAQQKLDIKLTRSLTK